MIHQSKTPFRPRAPAPRAVATAANRRRSVAGLGRRAALGAMLCSLPLLALAIPMTNTVFLTASNAPPVEASVCFVAGADADDAPLVNRVTLSASNAGSITDTVCITAQGPTVATIGQIELAAATPQGYLGRLGIAAMSDAELLELLAAWDADLAASLAGADRATLEAALLGYLDPDGDGQVALLQWQTLEERGTIGFYADRNEPPATAWIRLNGGLLPGLIDAPLGGEYLLADPDAQAGIDYRYRLIEQEAWGTQRTYGPYELRMEN